MALFSFYGQLLIKLQQRIAEKVPEIRYCDQDFGQLENYGEDLRPPVSWPCVLVDFTGTTYDQHSQQQQTGLPNIQVRLGFSPFSHTNSLAPVAVREKALQYYELENKLYAALQGWDADGLCQPLTRVNDGTERREDPFRVRVLNFTTAFDDYTASPQYQKVPRPDLELNFEC